MGAIRRAMGVVATIGCAMTAPVPTPATLASEVVTSPMIVGQVVAVHDHRIVVDTIQGQRVALKIDSRSIVPRNLASDMMVRIDYMAMNRGPKYAKRIALTVSHANTRRRMIPRMEGVPPGGCARPHGGTAPGASAHEARWRPRSHE